MFHIAAPHIKGSVLQSHWPSVEGKSNFVLLPNNKFAVEAVAEDKQDNSMFSTWLTELG